MRCRRRQGPGPRTWARIHHAGKMGGTRERSSGGRRERARKGPGIRQRGSRASRSREIKRAPLRALTRHESSRERAWLFSKLTPIPGIRQPSVKSKCEMDGMFPQTLTPSVSRTFSLRANKLNNYSAQVKNKYDDKEPPDEAPSKAQNHLFPGR